MKYRFKLNVFIALSTLLTWIGVGTVVFHLLEPWSLIESFYFSVVTISTVGFGDLVPSSDITRLFTAIYILIGVSIGVASLGVIGAEVLDHREKQQLLKNNSNSAIKNK